MALTPDGSIGGIAVVAESTYGTTPGSPTWLWTNHIDSSLVPQRTVIKPQWATFKPAVTRAYASLYVMGEIKTALALGSSSTKALLAAGSTLAGAVYTFGDGEEPGSSSISVLQNYGGGDATAANWFEWVFKGIKPTGYRFEISPDSNAVLTVPVIGQALARTADGSVSTPAPPADSGILMPSDIATVTYGGSSTAITIQSASISVDLPKTGAERKGLGATTIREPVSNGQPSVTFNVSVDLDATTGNDTIAILDLFVAGSLLGDLTIGPFSLTSCMLEGDPPSLSAGLMKYSLTGQATTLEVNTA